MYLNGLYRFICFIGNSKSIHFIHFEWFNSISSIVIINASIKMYDNVRFEESIRFSINFL